MYDWRSMTSEERERALELRRARQLPWHSPPHLDLEGNHEYLISAACYEHASIIGKSDERMTECEAEILTVCRESCSAIYGWCVLPNHYHLVIRTNQIKDLRESLGTLHGRSSFNGMVKTGKETAGYGTTASSVP
jgi:putative transposase